MTDPLKTFIETDAGPLFAVLERPAEGPWRAPILVCPPWGWDEMASYRSRRTWGEALARSGHPVLRFDLPGTGDSWGASGDPGLFRAWVEAIGEAARWLRERCGDPPRLVALGLGLGGLLALEAIESGAPIDELVLWAPPASGAAFVRETRAFSRMQRWSGAERGGSPLPEGWIEAAGFILSAATAAELKGSDPTTFDASPPLRRALLLGREELAVSAPLQERLEAVGVEVDTAAGLGWQRFTANPELSRPPEEVMRSVAEWLAAAGEAPLAAAPGAAAPDSATFAWAGGLVRESILSFPVAAGDGFGLVCEPAEGAVEGPCGLFLNAAADRHVGPNRIWVKAARDLARRGARTVRVDLEAVGEADGDSDRFVDEGEFFDRSILTQLTAVLDRLQAQGKADEFAVFGVSSGGYWGFRLALEDPRVRGGVLLNPSVFVWRPTILLERWGHGFGMLLRADLWARLFRGEFSPRKLLAMSRLLADRLGERVRGLFSRRDAGAAADPDRAPRDLEVEAAFDRLRDDGKELTVAFTDNESVLGEARGTLDDLGRWPNIRRAELPGLSHSLAPTSAQEIALGLILERFEELRRDRSPGPQSS